MVMVLALQAAWGTGPPILGRTGNRGLAPDTKEKN